MFNPLDDNADGSTPVSNELQIFRIFGKLFLEKKNNEPNPICGQMKFRKHRSNFELWKAWRKIVSYRMAFTRVPCQSPRKPRL